MKITLLTYGSRGDVEPFISLAQGFIHAGHKVCLAAPNVYHSLVDSSKIDFIGLPGEPQQLVQDFVDGAGKSQCRMILTMSKFVLPLAVRVIEETRAACEDADIIIHSFLFTSAGHEIAREMGVPDISAQLFPVFSSTAEFPAPTFPDIPLGGLYRRITHDIVTQTFRQGSRLLYKRVRRKNPGLPPLTSWPFDGRNEWQTPILYGFSSHVVPRPGDWRDEAYITGYWFSEDHGDWIPEKDLLNFINSGPPPISIVFGSIVTRNLEGIYKKVLEALSLSKQRGIIVGARHKIRDSSQAVFQADYVPYDWLFKRSAVVIHHGGAGTTGKGLLAGVPNIVLPFTSDQPFWGRRVYALGAGPRPIPIKNLSAGGLAAAIIAALNNEDMGKRAKVISEGIQGEDGVSRAVNIVEKYMKGKAGQAFYNDLPV